MDQGVPLRRRGRRLGETAQTTTPTPETRNAIDILVAEGQTQAQVMNWQETSPVALPLVNLTQES